MGFSSFNQQSKLGIMDEEAVEVDSVSSSSSEVLSMVSSESDSMDQEVTSSPSPSISPPSGQLGADSLHDMSSLLQQLPFKRGLSKHFQGKSQSFTSLSNVRCLADLAKPENPYNKRLKSCKSYAGLLDQSHRSSPNNPPRNNVSSRLISKKASRGSCSSLSAKRNASFLGSRPPINNTPMRSTSSSNISNQTPLFA
ncbi:protein OXIDATIVE STRESS 3-like [Cornus florida]|uniref:protein OXIDATIVE STRESS 3-like n=1 Tax=Cornus florida TaxID=4283 RepID=UPI0028989933|nr:protein OXIDATIVE STRESS 3-like [Cornus florida]